ncbi:MAG: PH domain-containing protein, partial [Bacteroidaceae bacterium]|nr:PH domain-containing protein [Bacteroidaceae bacterium]
MNRIFQARITLGQYLFLLLVSAMTVWALWDKHILIALVMAIVLMISIEKLIHTTFTITAEGHLVLYYGRFMAQKTIPLSEVTGVERACSIKVFGFGLMRCVLIHHGNKTEALMPVKEDEFIALI